MATAWKQVMTENLGSVIVGNLPAKTIVGNAGALGNAQAVTFTDIKGTILGLSALTAADNINLNTWTGTPTITTVGLINSE